MAVSAKQLIEQFFPAQLVMGLQVGQDGGECADLQGIMSGNGQVVLAAETGGQANVAAGLPGGLVSEFHE